MKILVIGGGGREHALAWKIIQSPLVDEIFCAPGNAGTTEVATNVDIAADNIDGLLEFARNQNIGLTVVGPEQPLVLGIVDRFEAAGLNVFGPRANAAEIEGSKAFSKHLMKKYNIPTAEYETFEEPGPAKAYLKGKNQIVVKADGLAAGKGVYVCQSEDEAVQAIDQIMGEKKFGESGNRVVIEELLTGQEVSYLAFTDGKTLLPIGSAQDHKAIYDGDKGPNTGGMGAYSPPPVFTEALEREVMKTIMQPTVDAMNAEGRLYKGVLYAGLMLTSQGPRVLEFNARFGDPETQVLMARLEGDIVPVMQACAQSDPLSAHKVTWHSKAGVCVVLAAGGYPGSYEKGKEISGLDEAASSADVTVFHAGTRMENGKVLTHGGRVLGVTALGQDIRGAIDNAYEAVNKIQWEGVYFRKDIGKKALDL